MANKENKACSFGLVGKNISYSFSERYFTEKFAAMGLENHDYRNYDLQSIEDFEAIIKEEHHLGGLNVTIPYKEEVIPYLAFIDPQAEKIGAVNTIKFTENGLKGYNTDAYGFKKALEPLLKTQHNQALILGTGGASKAIAYVLNELGIPFKFVSRNPGKGQLAYTDLDAKIMGAYPLLINCTPLGTSPNIESKPLLPYEYISAAHLLFDLIYNPEITAFMQAGLDKGASVTNGLSMLQQQAEKAWDIWNS